MQVEYLPKSDQPGLYLICVEGTPWREVHRLLFGRKQKLPKNVAGFPELEEICNEIEFQSARRYALWRLSRFSQTTAMLEEAFEKYLVTAFTQNRLITWLTENGYLNDRHYSERLVSLEQAKGRGPGAIRAKLLRKGLSYEQAQEALAGLDLETELATLRKVLETSKYKKYNINDFRERQKLIGSLARRGFSLESIRKALAKLI